MEKELTKTDVLILTNVWTGAAPFFYDAKKESRGMPAFNNVFQRLIDDERISKLHIIIWQPDRPIKIPIEYSEKISYYIISKRTRNILNDFRLVFETIIKGYKIVKENQNIKRIIGFGALAGITSIIGKLTNIPDFRRVYGSFLINEISNSKFSLFIKHPLEYITFSTKGKGLLVTNDGTKGDMVYRKIGNKNLPFYFPLNGIDKEILKNLDIPNMSIEKDFMVYVARLDSWKRQHLLIQALVELKRGKYNFPKTYIIGSPFDDYYVNELKQIVIDNDLNNEIEFIYGLPINQVHYMLYHSKLTFSLYHTSNLGNVFIESMQLGVPIIAINETSSLELIDKNAYYELKTDSILGISNAIKELLDNEEKLLSLKRNAYLYAEKNISSWKDRAKLEIDLMLS